MLLTLGIDLASSTFVMRLLGHARMLRLPGWLQGYLMQYYSVTVLISFILHFHCSVLVVAESSLRLMRFVCKILYILLLPISYLVRNL